jgi:hypothetical protein
MADYEVSVNRRDDNGMTQTVAIWRMSDDGSTPAQFLSAPDAVLVASLRRVLNDLEQRAVAAGGRPPTKASLDMEE